VLLLISFLISTNFILLTVPSEVRAQSINGGLSISNNTVSATNLSQRTYTNPTYGIILKYPDNWTFVPGSIFQKTLESATKSFPQMIPKLLPLHFVAYLYPNAIVVSNRTIAPTFVELLAIDNNNKSSLPIYVNDTLNQIKTNSINFTLLDKGSSTRLAGNVAEKMAFRYVPAYESRLIHTMSIAAIKGNKIYIFVFSSSPQSYGKYIRGAEGIKDSLIIK